MATKVEWKCPECGAVAHKHGAGGRDKCMNRGESLCEGFICDYEGEGEDHGTTYADPCIEANCYHCGWGGTFPPVTKGLQAWEKKALAAGWTPPEGRLAEASAANKK